MGTTSETTDADELAGAALENYFVKAEADFAGGEPLAAWEFLAFLARVAADAPHCGDLPVPCWVLAYLGEIALAVSIASEAERCLFPDYRSRTAPELHPEGGEMVLAAMRLSTPSADALSAYLYAGALPESTPRQRTLARLLLDLPARRSVAQA